MPALDYRTNIAIWLRPGLATGGAAGVGVPIFDAAGPITITDLDNVGDGTGVFQALGAAGVSLQQSSGAPQNTLPYLRFPGSNPNYLTHSIYHATLQPSGPGYAHSWHLLLRVNSYTLNGGIFGVTISDAYQLSIVAPGTSGYRLRYSYWNGSATPGVSWTTDMAIGQWYVVTCGWDGTNIFIYTNDDTPVALAATAPVAAANSYLRIGYRFTGPTYANFDLAELVHYNGRVGSTAGLTVAQRLAVYHYLADQSALRGDSEEQVRHVMSRRMAQRGGRRFVFGFKTPFSTDSFVNALPGTVVLVSHPQIPTADGKGAPDVTGQRAPIIVTEQRLDPNTMAVNLKGLDLRDAGHLHLETHVPKRILGPTPDGVLISSLQPGPRFTRRTGWACFRRPNDNAWMRFQPGQPRYESGGYRMEPNHRNSFQNPCLIDAVGTTWTNTAGAVREAIGVNDPWFFDASVTGYRIAMTRGAVGANTSQPNFRPGLTILGTNGAYEWFQFWYQTVRGSGATPATTFFFELVYGAGGTRYEWDNTGQTWGAVGTSVYNMLPESTGRITRVCFKVPGRGASGVKLIFGSTGAGGNNADVLRIYHVNHVFPGGVAGLDQQAWPVDYTGPLTVSVEDSSTQMQASAANLWGDNLMMLNQNLYRKVANWGGTILVALCHHWSDAWLQAAGADWNPAATSGESILGIFYDTYGGGFAANYIEVQAVTDVFGGAVKKSGLLLHQYRDGVETTSGKVACPVISGVTKLLVLRWNTNGEWGLTPNAMDLWYAGQKITTITPATIARESTYGRVRIGHWNGAWLQRFWTTDRVMNDAEIVALSKSAEAMTPGSDLIGAPGTLP